MRTIRTLNTAPNASLSPRPAAAIQQQRSPWHSPVPYLFGGLAAMLGLIAFALLILACSYWKLSGQLDSEEGGERELEIGTEKEGGAGKTTTVYEEKILVIMAGDEKPTFLATPVTGRACSFCDGNGKVEKKESEEEENGEEKMKDEMGNGGGGGGHDQEFYEQNQQ